MEQKAGAQISTKSFLQSVTILFGLMLAAGILTRILPSGSYARVDLQGRQVIDPASFHFTEAPDYPIWRWFTAPLEVLWEADALTIITIIVFLLMVGVSFAVLEKTGLLKAVVTKIVRAFKGHKYLLLLAVSFFFMAIGAFMGIFEEVVPLVPLMLALSYSMGWDALVGLGMSILAVNMGFSAAITNPFTIGVAQKLADLPLFSGAWLRAIIFGAFYAVFAVFLIRYARKVERDPESSSVFAEDKANRERYAHLKVGSENEPARLGNAVPIFLTFIFLILVFLSSAPLIPAVADYSMPIVGLLFFIGGISAGLCSGVPSHSVRKAALDGLIGISPAIPLILMAASIKHIVTRGQILDTIMHSAAVPFSGLAPQAAVLLVFFVTLAIEFFIASGSAKAFLLIPLMIPIAEMVGVTRQVTVTAYCFGDGFSNLAYPTNPVLLICLGLSAVSYPKWLRWSSGLWLWVILTAGFFLLIGTAIHYGPF